MTGMTKNRIDNSTDKFHDQKTYRPIMRKILLLTLVLLSFILSSCDPQMVFDQFKSTGDESWNWSEVREFDINMQDSTELFNIYINVRHTKKYPFSNLYVFVQLTSPDGNTLTDTIDIPIASPRGKWLGDGFGDIKFVRTEFREGVRFGQKGIYKAKLTQGMRAEEVPVTDIGIRVEKYTSLK